MPLPSICFSRPRLPGEAGVQMPLYRKMGLYRGKLPPSAPCLQPQIGYVEMALWRMVAYCASRVWWCCFWGQAAPWSVAGVFVRQGRDGSCVSGRMIANVL